MKRKACEGLNSWLDGASCESPCAGLQIPSAFCHLHLLICALLSFSPRHPQLPTFDAIKFIPWEERVSNRRPAAKNALFPKAEGQELQKLPQFIFNLGRLEY